MEINIDSLMRNSFGVLTGRCSVDDILEMYEGMDAMFYGNPLDLRAEELQEMLEYFENTEEYEKCSELVEAKKFIEFDKFLHKLGVINGVTNI